MTATSDQAGPVQYAGGTNIALKVPDHLFEPTVCFYRDVLRLPAVTDAPGPVFVFGTMRLWIDRVPALSQPELWLEINASDVDGAKDHLAESGVTRCDAIEHLPDGFPGFWVSGPGGVIHLICKTGA